MSEYGNGADGTCQNCGAETDEAHHAYCSSCWRAEQGWDEPESSASPYRPDPEQLCWQHEDRSRVVTSRLIDRVADLERRVAKLERELEGRRP